MCVGVSLLACEEKAAPLLLLLLLQRRTQAVAIASGVGMVPRRQFPRQTLFRQTVPLPLKPRSPLPRQRFRRQNQGLALKDSQSREVTVAITHDD